jgi:RNA polymerase sigma-70 factor (ECF subfamily)
MSSVCVSDDDLVARARQGDPAAFGALVDRHRSAVYRAALAALGSHAEAEDAAQEAFLLAYRRLTGFRGDASFKTWLLTIAWHQAINRRRSMTRLLRQIVQPTRDEDQDSTLEQLPAREVSPEDAAARSQLHRAIRAAIRSLTPKLRDALLLAQSGDYSYAEIGAMLDVPVGTIKWRVSEARKLVKARLQERGYRHVG